MFRVGAAAVVCAAVTACARAEPAQVGSVEIPYPSLDAVLAPGVAAAPAPDAVAAAAQPAATTAIPLPPGVYVGLFGLASAAIARRRYLKRR
jgi:hypothetical protein